ncbi:MAG: 4Fe-4S binding protein [Candidatus Eremiobacteraeota bacterium]|nr:4Fe-4S binding protein [Candidatus Eremiobacteraeota bacterium]
MSLNEERLPIIDEKKCTGCLLCMQVCSIYGCITIKERSVVK